MSWLSIEEHGLPFEGVPVWTASTHNDVTDLNAVIAKYGGKWRDRDGLPIEGLDVFYEAPYFDHAARSFSVTHWKPVRGIE